MSEEELAALPNLGPASARWLVGAGISTVAELRRAGPIAAFGRVAVREGRAATANLLYALYGRQTLDRGDASGEGAVAASGWLGRARTARITRAPRLTRTCSRQARPIEAQPNTDRGEK